MTDETTTDFTAARIEAQRAIQRMSAEYMTTLGAAARAQLALSASTDRVSTLDAEVARLTDALNVLTRERDRAFVVVTEKNITIDGLSGELSRVMQSVGVNPARSDSIEATLAEIARLQSFAEGVVLEAEAQPAPEEPDVQVDTPDDGTDSTPGETDTPEPGPEGPVGETTIPPADSDPVPQPPVVVTPAAPPLSISAPTSTSGITMLSPAGMFIPQTRGRDGQFVSGCGYVLDLPTEDSVFGIVPDVRATDGPAKGVIRYRATQTQVWPAPGLFTAPAGKWTNGGAVSHAAPPVYPAAAATMTPATLVGADGKIVPPLLDAAGNKWWRMEAWSDDSAITSEDKRRCSAATVGWLRVRAPGVPIERLPVGEYHFPEPITMGSDVVHGIAFFTENAGRPWGPHRPVLWRDDAHLAAIVARSHVTPEWKAYLEGEWRAGPDRNGKLRPRGAGHRWTWLDVTESWSILTTAFGLKAFPTAASNPVTRWLHDYPLDFHGNVPSVGVGTHEGFGVPGQTAVTYYGARGLMAVAFTLGIHGDSFTRASHPDGWSNVEIYRIRDTLARCAWEGFLRARIDHPKWRTVKRDCSAMWTTALHEFAAVLARVMPDYSSQQYGKAKDWTEYVDRNGSPDLVATTLGSGTFGLIESLADGTPYWHGGAYDHLHLCLGLTAVYDNATPQTPTHRDAWLRWLDGTMPGGSHAVWTPWLCNPAHPAYRDAVLAKYGRAAVIAEAVSEKGSQGEGCGVLGICLTEV